MFLQKGYSLTLPLDFTSPYGFLLMEIFAATAESGLAHGLVNIISLFPLKEAKLYL
jgi:hypothetical protein